MLDRDISTAAARRLLSLPDLGGDELGPAGWTRRGFLQAVGLGVVGGAAVGTLGESFIPGEVRDAFAGAPIGAGEGILITIMLYGGNDGLNTVIPYTNGLYYSQRANIAVPANQVLTINDQIGLHPNLPYLRSLYGTGQMAIVQGVGYPDPDLSHFTSMAIWMNARYGVGATTNGWIGRWLDGLTPAQAELGVATIDSSVALHLIGTDRRAVGISPYGDMFGADTEPPDLRMYDGFRAMAGSSGGRGPWHDMFASTLRTQLDVARDVSPVFAQALPDAELTRKMTIAARLVNANVGLRVIDVGLGGFDNHDDQLANHPDLLTDLNDAVQAFYATVSPQFRDRVTIMTMSEFGRTSFSNDSGGTDHGTANDLFVIGSKVKGGLYGLQPSLAGLEQWDRLEHNVDFRSVIGSVIDGWMGGGGSTILNGNFENLGLFTAAPGSGYTGPIIVLPPAPASGFVSIAPLRVFDTRDGTGGRAWPLGEQESWEFALTGRFGIPTDAVAVAMNLTSVEATAPTFITVSPTGEARPFASNLNPVPGAVIPNLVVARIGVNGAVNLFNNTGTVHVVADVVGYFTPSSNVGLDALPPARLLDTRDGTGGTFGAIGPGQFIDLQVTGRGGVSEQCEAVALNITVTEPTASSFVTVWPTGQERPLASSLNMVRGQIVPNLVLARVGAGGRVSIYNNSGSTHVVADVLGGFGPGVPSKFVTVSPSRVLDTREGIGAPRAPLGGTAMTLQLAGFGGVPGAGATAVLLNVTAVTPSMGTFVTVFPTGIERPNASNLNAAAGQVVPNMVIARLGPDGAAAIFNNSGAVDLVADVMGYFTT
ncbi:MAG: DUF1501 domain-containing protein [Actinomycetota bacterium]|jgi:uncharacterized protein (DUF1501 family)